MRKLILLACLAAVALSTACGGSNQIADQAASATKARAKAYAKASSLYPAPQMKNFPLRKALVDLTQRQDEVGHPWYVYVQGAATGQVIGYYVAKTAPQNECNTLSSTESIQYDDHGNVLLTAPTLNGVFAGGAGASGSCSTFFFEDASTNAMIELQGDAFFVTDQPLALDVPAFKVKATP